MPKILSIVIPYYDETTQDIFPLLASINNQVGIDFNSIECILVNDGNRNELPEEFLRLFANLCIRCVFMEENRGPGVARQFGIEHANGEYIMFCDADDVLHSVAVIGAFLQEIEQYHPDIIMTPWLEELYDDNAKSYVYLNHEREATWMHGKVFRRLFLQTKNIRFHDELRIHEDSYFLAQACAATENQRYVSFTSYVWRFMPDSITRRNNAIYTFESFPTYIKAMSMSFSEVEKISPEQMPYKVVQFLMYNYFTFHRENWFADEVKEYREKSEEAFKEFFDKFRKYYEAAAPELIYEVYNQERAKLFNGGIESEPLGTWMQRIGVTGND